MKKTNLCYFRFKEYVTEQDYLYFEKEQTDFICDPFMEVKSITETEGTYVIFGVSPLPEILALKLYLQYRIYEKEKNSAQEDFYG